ncbi:MAG TPA: thiolase family protein [Galbitalea sp.]|nr:thiolase family protein [Galbitalea sp.]
MTEVFVYDAVRTPIGKYGGSLAETRPDDLAGGVLRSLLARSPGLDPSTVEDVILGNANGAGEDNRNVARMAVLLAGLPTSIPGSTVNRLCGSGLDAVMQASRLIQTDDASIVVAGGVESMTRSPWVLPKPARGFPRGDETLHSTTLGWRMVNPRMPREWTISLGSSAEILAERYAIGRERQDEYAFESHRKAAAAWERGDFDAEVVTVEGAELAVDESVRGDTSLEALSRLRPVFKDGGTVTAGNSSPLNDGASAVLLASGAAGQSIGQAPLARIAGRASAGVDPDVFGIGPVEAANVALKRAGIGWGDLSLVEINEAFAVQTLSCLQLWPDLDPDIVNVSGGAIAIGHALGSSGSRILTSLVHGLRRRGGKWGLATICIGVGQGLAVVVEA